MAVNAVPRTLPKMQINSWFWNIVDLKRCFGTVASFVKCVMLSQGDREKDPLYEWHCKRCGLEIHPRLAAIIACSSNSKRSEAYQEKAGAIRLQFKASVPHLQHAGFFRLLDAEKKSRFRAVSFSCCNAL